MPNETPAGMKPFDLAAVLADRKSGENKIKVCTRDNVDVADLHCTNIECEFPVVAMVYGREWLMFTKAGTVRGEPRPVDLFIRCTKKTVWVNVYRCPSSDTGISLGAVNPTQKGAEDAIKLNPAFLSTISIEVEL